MSIVKIILFMVSIVMLLTVLALFITFLCLLIRLFISMIKILSAVFNRVNSGIFWIDTLDILGLPAPEVKKTKSSVKLSGIHLVKKTIDAEKIKLITAIVGLLAGLTTIVIALLKN